MSTATTHAPKSHAAAPAITVLSDGSYINLAEVCHAEATGTDTDTPEVSVAFTCGTHVYSGADAVTLLALLNPDLAAARAKAKVDAEKAAAKEQKATAAA